MSSLNRVLSMPISVSVIPPTKHLHKSPAASVIPHVLQEEVQLFDRRKVPVGSLDARCAPSYPAHCAGDAPGERASSLRYDRNAAGKAQALVCLSLTIHLQSPYSTRVNDHGIVP